ncbi:MAG: ParB/RepB/Spo0J family partition protein [Candidatus Aminicenantales bacterium]
MEKEQIPLDRIDLKDERFRISFYFSTEKLLRSIQQIGLIHPPLVTRRDSRLILVSGWKRVLACQSIPLPSIPVRKVESSDDLETFLLAFYENWATREFTLLEKAEILRKLERLGEEEGRIIRNYLPLLDIPQTVYYLELYLKISRLESQTKAFIHEKKMPPPNVEWLVRFKRRERELLLPLLRPLGQNKQKEVLEDLWHVSLREGIPAERILKSEQVMTILESERLSPLQKSDRLRQVLRRRRYPQLTSWEKAFQNSLEKAGWPEEISIEHAPFFEEEEMTVRFRFRDEEEFRSCVQRLQKVASRGEFSRLFKRPTHE